MGIWNFLPALLIVFIYLGLLVGLFYLIYKWATKIISLKQEHNELLKEIIKKLENK